MSLSLRTSLLLGAVLQSLLLVVLPTKYAVAPAIIYLGSIFIDAVLVTTGKRPNPYLEGMPAKKFSAMLPDENGELNGPGKEKVAVLLLGAKFNHPLGFFAPKAKDFGDWAQSMYSQLEDPENQDNGCKSQQNNLSSSCSRKHLTELFPLQNSSRPLRMESHCRKRSHRSRHGQLLAKPRGRAQLRLQPASPTGLEVVGGQLRRSQAHRHHARGLRSARWLVGGYLR